MGRSLYYRDSGGTDYQIIEQETNGVVYDNGSLNDINTLWYKPANQGEYLVWARFKMLHLPDAEAPYNGDMKLWLDDVNPNHLENLKIVVDQSHTTSTLYFNNDIPSNYKIELLILGEIQGKTPGDPAIVLNRPVTVNNQGKIKGAGGNGAQGLSGSQGNKGQNGKYGVQGAKGADSGERVVRVHTGTSTYSPEYWSAAVTEKKCYGFGQANSGKTPCGSSGGPDTWLTRACDSKGSTNEGAPSVAMWYVYRSPCGQTTGWQYAESNIHICGGTLTNTRSNWRGGTRDYREICFEFSGGSVDHYGKLRIRGHEGGLGGLGGMYGFGGEGGAGGAGGAGGQGVSYTTPRAYGNYGSLGEPGEDGTFGSAGYPGEPGGRYYRTYQGTTYAGYLSGTGQPGSNGTQGQRGSDGDQGQQGKRGGSWGENGENTYLWGNIIFAGTAGGYAIQGKNNLTSMSDIGTQDVDYFGRVI